MRIRIWDPEDVHMDPDPNPGGLRLCGSGSETLVFTVLNAVLIFFLNHVLYLFFFTFSCYFYKFFEFFIKVLFSCVLSSLYHIWSLILAGGGPGGDPDLPEPEHQDQEDAGAGDGAAAVEAQEAPVAQVAHTIIFDIFGIAVIARRLVFVLKFSKTA